MRLGCGSVLPQEKNEKWEWKEIDIFQTKKEIEARRAELVRAPDEKASAMLEVCREGTWENGG